MVIGLVHHCLAPHGSNVIPSIVGRIVRQMVGQGVTFALGELFLSSVYDD